MPISKKSNKRPSPPPRRRRHAVAQAKTAVVKMTAVPRPPPDKRFILKPELLARVGASWPSIWRMIGEEKFPAAVSVGGRPAWLESTIDNWMSSRPVRKYKKMEVV
jgi:prophage regulatory protein